MKRRSSPDQPVCFFGRLTFEFFNNDDEEFKVKTMRSLAKEVRKELNVSCIAIDEGTVENPERGALTLALVAADHDQGKALLDKTIAWFDGKAPARIMLEEFDEAELN